jgi:eukaryotic-like serine/threonine-protein kinase
MDNSTPQERPRKVFLGRFLPPGSLLRRLVLWVGIPLVLIFLLAIITDQIVMPIITRQGSAFPLPSFVDQRVIEAEMRLEELDLTYEIAGEEFAPGKDKGVIISQFPISGTQVKPGRIIKFVISAGEKIITVPSLAGKSVRQATLDLEAAQLLLGEVSWTYSDTIPERVVVFSFPAGGSEVLAGTPINLMVNRGRASEYTYVPRVVGLPLDAARKAIEQRGLKVGRVTYRQNEEYLPDTVLEQSEPEGTELIIGQTVDLLVSKT